MKTTVRDRALGLTTADIERAIELPSESWGGRCHEVSLMAVGSGVLGEPGPTCRVVRGSAPGYGIGGQHSWIALGDPYDPKTVYVDVTAQAWDNDVEGLLVSYAADNWLAHVSDARRWHLPFGYDSRNVMKVGRPAPPGPGEKGYLLEGELSDDATSFLDLLGPLTSHGWSAMFGWAKGGWSYREILTAAVEQVPRVNALTSIDLIGHGTDLNPQGLYW